MSVFIIDKVPVKQAFAIENKLHHVCQIYKTACFMQLLTRLYRLTSN